jgi:hypothetical protein
MAACITSVLQMIQAQLGDDRAPQPLGGQEPKPRALSSALCCLGESALD